MKYSPDYLFLSNNYKLNQFNFINKSFNLFILSIQNHRKSKSLHLLIHYISLTGLITNGITKREAEI